MIYNSRAISDGEEGRKEIRGDGVKRSKRFKEFKSGLRSYDLILLPPLFNETGEI